MLQDPFCVMQACEVWLLQAILLHCRAVMPTKTKADVHRDDQETTIAFEVLIHCTRGDNRSPAVAAAALAAFFGHSAARVGSMGERFYITRFLFLVVRPGAPSSVLAPSSDALCS